MIALKQGSLSLSGFNIQLTDFTVKVSVNDKKNRLGTRNAIRQPGNFL